MSHNPSFTTHEQQQKKKRFERGIFEWEKLFIMEIVIVSLILSLPRFHHIPTHIPSIGGVFIPQFILFRCRLAFVGVLQGFYNSFVFFHSIMWLGALFDAFSL